MTADPEGNPPPLEPRGAPTAMMEPGFLTASERRVQGLLGLARPSIKGQHGSRTVATLSLRSAVGNSEVSGSPLAVRVLAPRSHLTRGRAVTLATTSLARAPCGAVLPIDQLIEDSRAAAITLESSTADPPLAEPPVRDQLFDRLVGPRRNACGIHQLNARRTEQLVLSPTMGARQVPTLVPTPAEASIAPGHHTSSADPRVLPAAA